jgi:hypothetical protein
VEEGPALRVKSSWFDEQDSQFLEEMLDEHIGEARQNSLALRLYDAALRRESVDWAASPLLRAIQVAVHLTPDHAHAPLQEATQVARHVAAAWGEATIDRNTQDASMLIALSKVPRPLTRHVGAICAAVYDMSLNRQEAAAMYLLAILPEQDGEPLRQAIRDGLVHDPALDGDLRK